MICVSLQNKDFATCKQHLRECEMAEIRADLCRFTTPQLEELVCSHPNILITCRIEHCSEPFSYQQITRSIMKGAKYVDVEIEAPITHLEYIKSYANANACKLIISYHNFEGTNTLDELMQIYDLCLRKGADLVKIVTTAHTTADAVRTLSLYQTERYRAAGAGTLIAFAMGEAGKFTRHLCLQLGAPFTYVAYDHASATAPGQYTRAEMEKLLAPENYPVSIAGRIPQQVTIPCSKSIAQRAILAAALAKGETVLDNFAPCNDINGALEVVGKLGAKISRDGSTLRIQGAPTQQLKQITSLETGESGLLTRLLLPFAAYLSGIDGNEIQVTGHGSLLKRNLGESAHALTQAGVECSTNGYLPFRLSGGIRQEKIEFSGKESSQIVSGFLMTLPLLPQTSTLIINHPSSLPYIRLTLRTLEQFGIRITVAEETPNKITCHIPGGQQYTPAAIYLDADWSSAAYFAIGGVLGKGITLRNMPLKSDQADEALLDILRLCGAGVQVQPTPGTAIQTPVVPLANIILSGGKLRPFEYDATHCPDLFPALALLASHCTGTSKIKGVNRLLQKESNRAESVYSEFTILGAKITIREDEMYITGTTLHGGQVRSHNDHRIAMSLLTAGLFTPEPVRLDEIQCIHKSFPTFTALLEAR